MNPAVIGNDARRCPEDGLGRALVDVWLTPVTFPR
jgi:hypothetical protein